MDFSPVAGPISRRRFLQALGVVGAGLAVLPRVLAADGNQQTFYKFVNNTKGRWTDAQCFWSLNDGKDWHSFADASTTPCLEGGGRAYICAGTPPRDFDDRQSYWDFVEWNYKLGGNWSGNTTQVDAFGLPLAISLGEKKVGIPGLRSDVFRTFRKECPEPFRDCVKQDFFILSPARAGFGKGGPHGDYFDAYVAKVWDTYASKKTTPSGKYTGEVSGTALTFTPVNGGSSFTCESKPTTQDILLGQGVLARNAQFCAAFNRHVADDPADWKEPANFYLAEPCNWYSKFLHERAIDHKCYGFCYDDVAEQAAYFSAKGDTLTITLNWD